MKKAYSLAITCLILFFASFIISCNGQTDANANTVELTALPGVIKPYVVTDSIVRSIFKDSKGNIWLGRGHAGLTRYDGKSYTHYSIEDGLSDNQIRTIQEDREGNLWFATGNGVSKYDGEKFSIHKSSDPLTSDVALNDR